MTDCPAPPEFVPVRTASTRHDGWTPERQHRFLSALAVSGVVAHAARAVGKSARSAYRLRLRPDAASFARAWDQALEEGRDRAFDVAVDRALNGYETPRYYKGRQIGVIHRLDNRLIVHALMPPPVPPGRGR